MFGKDKRKDKLIENLIGQLDYQRDQVDYLREERTLISTKLARVEKENEMLNEILNGHLEKKSDTELIRYKGKTYKIVERTLNDAPNERESLDISCVEWEIKDEQ